MKRWRENGEQKKWRELKEQRNRGALSCRVMTAEIRDALSDERNRNPMREWEKGGEAIIVLYLFSMRWDLLTVSCKENRKISSLLVGMVDFVLVLSTYRYSFMKTINFSLLSFSYKIGKPLNTHTLSLF